MTELSNPWLGERWFAEMTEVDQAEAARLLAEMRATPYDFHCVRIEITPTYAHHPTRPHNAMGEQAGPMTWVQQNIPVKAGPEVLGHMMRRMLDQVLEYKVQMFERMEAQDAALKAEAEAAGVTREESEALQQEDRP